MSMNSGSRHEAIRALVARTGFITIEALAQRFGVTPQTVRRDINYLAKRGDIRRYHGGAGLPSSVENAAYTTRRVHNAEIKERIAGVVAAQIPDNASLFINIGTTTEAVARALVDHKGLRVITNNMNVALSLMPRPDIEVLIAGGVVRSRDGGIVGESAVEFIRQFKVDFGIIGISGIDQDGSLLDFDYRETKVAQAIIANSRRVFLVADSSKFGRNAMVRMGHLSDVSALFTDGQLREELRDLALAHEVELHLSN